MQIEIRSGTSARISGYVNAVARDSRRLPSCMCPGAKRDFIERVEPDAFRRAIEKNGNIEIRFNHERSLGNTADGSLTLKEDNVGLFASAEIQDREVIEKAERGELRGWSFGFAEAKDRWESLDNRTDRRILEDFELREVSLLDKTPAYFGTSVTAVELRGGEEKARITERRSCEAEPTVVRCEAPEKTAVPCDCYRRQIEILRLSRRPV